MSENIKLVFVYIIAIGEWVLEEAIKYIEQ